jgi:hypothetical protein
MQLATTANELLSDPWFVMFAPVGVIVVLLVIYFVFGGDTDL